MKMALAVMHTQYTNVYIVYLKETSLEDLDNGYEVCKTTTCLQKPPYRQYTKCKGGNFIIFRK